MTRHAPLYGAGLDSLHDSELGVLMRIHDDGIKRIQVSRDPPTTTGLHRGKEQQATPGP